VLVQPYMLMADVLHLGGLSDHLSGAVQQPQWGLRSHIVLPGSAPTPTRHYGCILLYIGHSHHWTLSDMPCHVCTASCFLPAGPIVLVLKPPANRVCVSLYRISVEQLERDKPLGPSRMYSVAPADQQQQAAFGFYGDPRTTYAFTVVAVGHDDKAGPPTTIKETTGP
jgi:hypothetical protein